jgi:hypothetical protein
VDPSDRDAEDSETVVDPQPDTGTEPPDTDD